MSSYLWGKWPHQHITHTFVVTSPLCGDITSPPYVNIEGEFFLPWASPPKVFDTLMCVASHKILVMGYLNLHNHSFPNPNLLCNFPLIPWKGEIAILFIGACKPYVSQAPPKSLLHFAIAQWVFVSYVLQCSFPFPSRYMTVCLAHVEAGHPFPSYIERSAFHLTLSTNNLTHCLSPVAALAECKHPYRVMGVWLYKDIHSQCLKQSYLSSLWKLSTSGWSHIDDRVESSSWGGWVQSLKLVNTCCNCQVYKI